MTYEDAHRQSLEDAYDFWLGAPHPKRPGVTNAARSLTDRLNHRRGLECLAAADAGRRVDLAAAPSELLDTLDAVLANRVVEGARVLNAERGRLAPKEKALKNLIACCRAVRDVVLQAGGKASRRTPRQVLLAKPRHRIRRSFPRERWPERLKGEWPGYCEWKSRELLTAAEGAHLRGRVCKANTVEQHALRITPIVRYLVDELGMCDVGLVDLMDVDRYIRFMDWYLNEDAYGGYSAARLAGVTLATISQYLVAMGRIGREGPGGLDIWAVFYRESRKALEVGARRGELPERRRPDAWTPNDMRHVASQAWDQPAPRYWRGDGDKRKRQAFARLRYGLFFALAVEAPMRARNFREMRWDKHLKRTREGLWQVHFRGQELKIATRGGVTNEYKVTFTPWAGAYIERWRRVLEEKYGPDFEQVAPYVFASGNLLGKPISDAAFHMGIETLALEVRGETFEPHDARRVVATHLVDTRGTEGIALAALLLGDTAKMIFDTYFRPDTEATLRAYLDELDEAA